MSDNLHIYLDVEIYDLGHLSMDPTSEALKDRLARALKKEMCQSGFGDYDDYIIHGSVL
jgi:hypothetical protein